MADPSLFDPIRGPVSALVALDCRPYHYVLRTAHVVAMGGFFGGIGLLDFRFMGWRGTVPLRSFSEHVLPWLWATFGVAVVTGVALFLYDPVRIGSHAYWAPKLLAIAVGLANAALFHRASNVAAFAPEARLPTSARAAGAFSLGCWTRTVVFACLDTEGPPEVLLR